MKMCVMFLAPATNFRNLKIPRILKVSRCFIFTVRNELHCLCFQPHGSHKPKIFIVILSLEWPINLKFRKNATTVDYWEGFHLNYECTVVSNYKISMHNFDEIVNYFPLLERFYKSDYVWNGWLIHQWQLHSQKLLWPKSSLNTHLYSEHPGWGYLSWFEEQLSNSLLHNWHELLCSSNLIATKIYICLSYFIIYRRYLISCNNLLDIQLDEVYQLIVFKICFLSFVENDSLCNRN